MNEHLQAAIKFSQDAAYAFDRNRRIDTEDNVRLALAAAAIAQAEAAERQAVAMEKIAMTLVTIAAAMGER